MNSYPMRNGNDYVFELESIHAPMNITEPDKTNTPQFVSI